MPINIWINLEIKAKKRGTIDEQYEDEENLVGKRFVVYGGLSRNC